MKESCKIKKKSFKAFRVGGYHRSTLFSWVGRDYMRCNSIYLGNACLRNAARFIIFLLLTYFLLISKVALGLNF